MQSLRAFVFAIVALYWPSIYSRLEITNWSFYHKLLLPGGTVFLLTCISHLLILLLLSLI
jgi:hypothetical protein